MYLRILFLFSSSIIFLFACNPAKKIVKKNSISNERKDTQSNNCYENLDFKSFLDEKVENDTSLIRELYKNIKHPIEAKKYETQGIVEVIILNNSEISTEVIQLNSNGIFPDVAKQIYSAINQVKIDRKKPFTTKLYVNFDLDPFRYKGKDFKEFSFGLINNNMIVIREYIIPEINSH